MPVVTRKGGGVINPIFSPVSEILQYTGNIDSIYSNWHAETSEDPVSNDIKNKQMYHSVPVSQTEAKYTMESLIKLGFDGDARLISENAKWICVHKIAGRILP